MEHGALSNLIYLLLSSFLTLIYQGFLSLLSTSGKYVIQTHTFEDTLLNSFYKCQLTFLSCVFKLFKHLSYERDNNNS